ncbi:hypothetical protein ACFL20_07235 [Spirochaetota bacterium]
MKKTTSIITPLLIIFLVINGFSETVEEKLYKKTIKQSFTSDKVKYTRRLGRLRTRKAKNFLMKLLNSKDPWNREAAVAGLILFKNSRTGRLLFDKMISDTWAEDEIKKGFKKHIRYYYMVLVNRYKFYLQSDSSYQSSKNRDIRKKIINIIGSSKTPKGDSFLKSVIENAGSEDRVIAFKNLAKHYPKNNYSYIRKKMDIPLFRVDALIYLVKNGKAPELKMFLEIINKREPPKYRLVAYRAVAKWGNPALKLRIFIEAMGEKDETLTQGGLYIFKKVKSVKVMKLLCRIVKKGKFQKTRIPAAMRLLEYRSKEIIPSLVLILNEKFIPKEQGGVDVFLAAVTFGLVPILDLAHQRHRKSSFYGKQIAVGNHLKGLTGMDFNTSYEKWFEWAIYNGYTINGVNIIQYLYSGYKEKRDKAVIHSVKLLGFRNIREFFSKYGNFKTDTELSMKLARLLVEKGYLKDENY